MQEKSNIIIRHNRNDYYFGCLPDIYTAYEYKHESGIYSLIEKLGLFCNISNSKWRRCIQSIDSVIIFDYGWSEEITRYIKHVNPKCIINLYFYNPICNENHHMMLNDQNIDRYWSIDTEDVKKYNLSYNSSFFSKRLYTRDKSDETYDLVFVGTPKERKNIVDSVCRSVEESGFNIYCRIPENRDDYLPYMEYLDMVRRSSCILDITNPGQSGLTLRVMESLFLSKKLITNNVNILSYEFFNDSNIYVLGNDNRTIKEFMSVEFQYYDESIIDYYDFIAWRKRFEY